MYKNKSNKIYLKVQRKSDYTTDIETQQLKHMSHNYEIWTCRWFSREWLIDRNPNVWHHD